MGSGSNTYYIVFFTSNNPLSGRRINGKFATEQKAADYIRTVLKKTVLTLVSANIYQVSGAGSPLFVAEYKIYRYGRYRSLRKVSEYS